ncbi:MAG: chemotaxis-specific protein-glutamate methyltransferase CheB [Cyanobacteria bacterium J06648_11]
MPKLRVLVVDDAVVVRQLVSKVLAGDPELEVVGVAANGRIGLAKIPQVNPDAIVLDLEMPEMDGLEMLQAVRDTYPQLPVIMFSALTERGAAATLDALALGASDYVTKPTSKHKEEAMAYIRMQLIPRLKALCPGVVARPQAVPTPASASPARTLTQQHSFAPIDILAIGVSTGGPNALVSLLSQLPAEFPVPIVIVQHMPPLFTKRLAERLNAQSSLNVAEAEPGARLLPGQAWLAPGDFHMAIARAGTEVTLNLHQGAPENSCRPAVDVLFRSVVTYYGAGTLGLILTGMGQDGLNGCACIREAGGQVWVQDEASSVVWGMPGIVAEAGLADRVLPLAQIPGALAQRVAHRGRGEQLARPAKP